MLPFIPLFILALGAGGLLLGLLPRFRYTGLVAILASGLACAAVLALAFRLPARATLSAWGPPSLLPLGLQMEMDAIAWLFATAVLGLAAGTLLTGVARGGGRRLVVRMAVLLTAFAGVAAIFADNLVTRVMAWAGLDLVYFLALILLARGGGLEPQAVLNLAFNTLGTLFAFLAALLISRESSALSIRDAALTPQSTLLVTLAAVFRLGLFPLHLGLPAEANIRQGLGTMLRLVPAAVALELMARLALLEFAAAARPWLAVFGLAAVVFGALELWNVDDPRLGLTYLVIAQSGLALLAGLWGGAGPLVAQSLALVAGGGLIYLSNGHDDARPVLTGLPLLGALVLLGAPLTVGFAGWSGLLAGLWDGGSWLALAVILPAQAILAAGLLRSVFWPGAPLEPVPLIRASYLAGLGWLAALAVAMGWLATAWLGGAIPGVLPAGVFGFSGIPSLLALLVLALVAAAGLGLWRFDALVRERIQAAGAGLASLGRLDWLYRLVWTVVRGAGMAADNLAAVMEGEGAVLWAIVAALLIWLLIR